jgi:hypothetical protein
MQKRLYRLAVFLLGISALSSAVYAQTSSSSSTQKEARTTNHATGPFEVKLNPLPAYNEEDKAFGRMSIDKQFHGDLEATSKGEMLAYARLAYVALEKVTGSLRGRTGTFVLQHEATMVNGTPTLTITVVPTSGTGQLTGLEGKMNIIIAPGGKHSYDFDYTLPDTH